MSKYYNDNLIIEDGDSKVIFNVPSSRIFSVYKYDDLQQSIEKINHRCKKMNVPKKIPNNIKYRKLIISCSETCNLKCKYCFANEGTYNLTSNKIMGEKEFDKLLEFIKELDYRVESLCLFGGEPLLVFKEIKKFIEKMTTYYDEKEWVYPRLGIVTNGTLITKEIVEFFGRYKFNVSISVDGNKEKNDANRIFKGNNNSVYERISEVMKLMTHRNFTLTASATFSRNRIFNYEKGDYENTVEDLSKLGFDIVECFLADEDKIVTEKEKENIEEFAKDQIRYLFKEVKKGEKLKNLSRIPLGIVSSIVKKKYAAECPAGKYLVYYTAVGELYPCQMYYARKRKTSTLISRSENKFCKECFAKNICNGYCPGSSVLTNGTENSVIESRCIFNKALIEETILQLNKYLSKMLIDEIEITVFASNMIKLSKEYSMF